jgi:hypothetical protein
MIDDDETANDHWAKAHEVALDHLNKCFSILLDDEDDEFDEDDACAPFCGCETCVVREVLYAALPHIERHLNKVYLEEIPDAPPA